MSIILFEHIAGDTVGPVAEPLSLGLEAHSEGHVHLIDGWFARELTVGRGMILNTIYVPPEHRGRHFGSDLLEAVTEWVDEVGVGLALAAVPDEDCPIDVVSWYERWGWGPSPWTGSENILWRPPATSIEQPASGSVGQHEEVAGP